MLSLKFTYFTQILTVFTATFSFISDGMQFGWCSPTIPKLLQPDSPIAISHNDVMWLDSMYMFGGIAGLPITLYLSDKIGRKLSVSTASIVFLVAWLLIIFGTSVEYIYIARFLAGLGGNMSFVCMPMYIGEIAQKKIRGFLSSFIPIMNLIGVIIIYTVAPILSIQSAAYIGISFPIIQLITFSFMPETPYYLQLLNRPEEAKKSLQFLRGNKTLIDEELVEIQEAVIRQESERGKLQDMFLVDSNRKGLIIMIVLFGSQHFSANSVILMNLHTILGDANELVSTNIIAIIFSVTMLLSAIIGSLLMDKFGRKQLLIISCILTASSLFIIAIYFNLRYTDMIDNSYSWIPAATVIFYSVAYRLGLGVIPLVVTGEIFPTKVKALGMTFSDMSFIVFGILSLKVYHFLTDMYGMHVPFYIFDMICIITAIFTIFYIPETKGKSLEEIQMMLKGQKN